MNDKDFIIDQLVNAYEHCDEEEMTSTLQQTKGYKVKELVKTYYELGHRIYIYMFVKGIDGITASEIYLDAFVDTFKEESNGLHVPR